MLINESLNKLQKKKPDERSKEGRKEGRKHGTQGTGSGWKEGWDGGQGREGGAGRRELSIDHVCNKLFVFPSFTYSHIVGL